MNFNAITYIDLFINSLICRHILPAQALIFKISNLQHHESNNFIFFTQLINRTELTVIFEYLQTCKPQSQAEFEYDCIDRVWLISKKSTKFTYFFIKEVTSCNTFSSAKYFFFLFLSNNFVRKAFPFPETQNFYKKK